jgi:hypothetical protein
MGTFFSLSKSATSTALDISEIALLLFGVLLVAGLIGEYAKSERWKRRVKIFEMFVIIGVAGELLADGGIFLFSRQLQTIADLEIAEITKKAGEAKNSANEAAGAAQRSKDESAKATASASNALALASGARQEADSFEKDIVSAKEQAAKAESHLAEALRRATEAQLSLDKLRSPRRLTPEQQKRIAAKLKSFGMQFDLALTNLPEPTEFSLTLENTLGMGGWTEIDGKGGDIVSTRPSGRTTGFVTVTGVVVQMHKEQVAKFWGAATALAEALKAEGIDATAQPGVGPKNDNNNAIHILVGEKPKE